jgi:hypothetical protein
MKRLPRSAFAFDEKRGVWQFAKTEEHVLCEIRTYLEILGAKVFRAIERVPKCYRCGLWLGHSEAGMPDLSGYFAGDAVIPFWFEIKRPKSKATQKGKVRKAQLERIEQLRRDGCCAAIVDSVHEVRKELARCGIVGESDGSSVGLTV